MLMAAKNCCLIYGAWHWNRLRARNLVRPPNTGSVNRYEEFIAQQTHFLGQTSGLADIHPGESPLGKRRVSRVNYRSSSTAAQVLGPTIPSGTREEVR